jgi:putative acyl-CoA dehydrogenase
VQAIHHCRHRRAFGSTLDKQPLMQNLLADLALESEAAMTLTLRMSRAFDQQNDEHEKLFARIATPIGKYWICKRTTQHAYEAMEVIGGMGLMENTIMPRLLREAPVNSIWEGSGNVQCLDILRAVQKEPKVLEAYFNEVSKAAGKHPLLDNFVNALHNDFMQTPKDDWQYHARRFADRMALALQGALLVQYAPDFVAEAFCHGRLAPSSPVNYGSLPGSLNTQGMIERAFA